MNEAETRAEHIDPALKAAGWGVVEGSRIRREYPITRAASKATGGAASRSPPITCWSIATHKLAVVEAKAWDEALTEGVAQAKNYAGKLAIRFTYCHQRPGHLRHRHGDRQRRRDARAYPTPDELWNLTFAKQNAWRDRFAAVPFEDKGGSIRAATTRTSPSSA